MKLGLMLMFVMGCGGSVDAVASAPQCAPIDAGPCFSGWTELPNAVQCDPGASPTLSQCENVSAVFGVDQDSAPTYWCCK